MIKNCDLQPCERGFCCQNPGCGFHFPKKVSVNCRARSSGAAVQRRNSTPNPCSKKRAKKLKPPPANGPGFFLKKKLRWFKIDSDPNCKCNARAEVMDRWGPDHCEKRLEKIVGWLREEAERRGSFLYSDRAARILVKSAIKASRKAGWSKEVRT